MINAILLYVNNIFDYNNYYPIPKENQIKIKIKKFINPPWIIKIFVKTCLHQSKLKLK